MFKFTVKVCWNHSVPFVQEWRIPHSRFHADFYLHEERLIVEIDGDYWHSTDDQIERDNRKDELCSTMGLGVLRIDAMDLVKHFKER